MMKLFDYAQENPTKCGGILDEILVFLYEREIIDLANRIKITKSKLDHHQGRAQRQRATHDERVTESEEEMKTEEQRIRKNRSDNGSKRMKGL
jgi:predicted Holliday junction resolvase-like endonuclease